MSKYNEMPWLRLLLENEAGIKVDGCNDSDMKPAYERNRTKMFVHDKDDNGGATMCGVTFKTFAAATKDNDYDHFLKMSYERWSWIATRMYWDKLKCSQYDCLPLAIAVADYGFNSGVTRAAKALQKELNDLNEAWDFKFGKPLYVDGIIGEKTLAMLQKLPSLMLAVLFDSCIQNRKVFVCGAVKDGTINKKFEKGLLNRIRRTYAYGLRYFYT